MHALNKVSIKWSNKLAYVIGLITTDGNLSPDSRHIAFVSKDLQLIRTFKSCLKINNKVGFKKSSFAPEKKYYCVQFGDVRFYNFLLSIGLTPAKSKSIGCLKIPNKYFFDFLRGHFDGDGCCFSYWDKRWRSSFMFYTSFISASEKHLFWIKSKIESLLHVKGYLGGNARTLMYQLRFAKAESKKIISKMYYKKELPRLERKYIKLRNILKTNEKETSRKAQKLCGRGATG